MSAPGARNLITDVDGIRVGSAADGRVRTGVTVVLPDVPVVAGVDVRGAAPGTRETDLLDPTCMVETVDAICLSGGSVHGLQAADAVVRWLAGHARGFVLGPWRVPLVPGAIIFDLASGGDKDWGSTPPYAALAAAACDAVDVDFALGNAGAGFGARAGKLKGGLGSASVVTSDGIQVGALVVANPVGAVTMPGCGTLWAWPFEQVDEMGRQHPPQRPAGTTLDLPEESRLAANTSLAVVATNVKLSKAEAKRVAMMAHDGMARSIRPVHTPFDGDTIFALSTGRREMPEPSARTVARIGSMAADCVARSVGRAVFEAEGLGDLPGYRDVHGEAFAVKR